MKTIFRTASLGLVLTLAGCTTSSQVQEMIDASHRDYLTRAETQQQSINVLKQSAKTSLEKNRANADRLEALETQMKEVKATMDFVRDSANAAKVMSAANTVKADELEKALADYMELTDETLDKMATIDKLYEEVLILQYQKIADSANAAIAALKADGVTASTNAPVRMDSPIEIVAPDTSPAATNGYME